MELQDISFDENDITKNLFLNYRIRAEGLNPIKITAFLGIEPTKSYTRGERYLSKTLDHKTNSLVDIWRIRQKSLWDLDSKSISHTTKKVEDHVDFILNILEPRSTQIRMIVEQVEKYTISFYLRWIPKSDHGSYIISSNHLDRMAKLSHFVEYSFMSTNDDNENEPA